MEEPKVMLAIDGVSYDWSYMVAKEEAPSESAMVATEIALMAFFDSEVHSIENCSKCCKALKECERLIQQFIYIYIIHQKICKKYKSRVRFPCEVVNGIVIFDS